MTAEERYPECDGRLMAGSQAGACGRCLRHTATAAPTGLADTPLFLRTPPNAFEPGSSGAYIPKGRKKCRK
jgi:hypothetical protein